MSTAVNAKEGLVEIPNDVREAIAAGKWEGDKFKMYRQLDRKLYVKVNEVLTSCGGEWVRKAKAHVFDGDGQEQVQLVIDQGFYVSQRALKKAYQWFYTPTVLADYMAELLIPDVDEAAGKRYLEPSAGEGALVDAVLRRYPEAQVDCCELEPDRAKGLQRRGLNCVKADFLTHDFEDEAYDGVIMNPPFTKFQDTLHVCHAFSKLKPGGRLVAVTSRAWQWQSRQVANDFRVWLEKWSYTSVELPAGTFAESGTQVPAMLLVITKEM